MPDSDTGLIAPTFSQIIGTLIACADEAINRQERELLAALHGAVRYELAGGKLRLFYEGGKVLTFGAASA
jgi:heat shock protein HslJ